MELKSLRFFLKVAAEKSVSKAAAALYISQPALTRQIQALEYECGKPLFVRSKHGVTLTEEGMLLQTRAMELLELADKTINDIKQSNFELAGRISIGCGELASFRELSKIMADFKKNNPKVFFDIFTGNADLIKLKIERGTLDLGLLLEPVDVEQFESFRVNIKEQYVVLMRRDDKLAEKEKISYEDLKGKSLILPSRRYIQKSLNQWFQGSLSYAKSITSNLTNNAAMLVEQGLGYSIVIDAAYSFKSNDNVVFSPLDPPVFAGSVIAYKKNVQQSKLLDAFIKDLLCIKDMDN